MIETSKYHPIPQPDEIDIREKEDAMGAYLMMFASIGAGLPLPFINLLAAVIYYYINKSKSRFVRFHSFQSVVSQMPITILNGIGVVWFFRILFNSNMYYTDFFKGYILMLITANILYFIFSIIAAVKARKGYFYYFLFFGRLSYHQVYKVRPDDEGGLLEKVNVPPKM
ncbi:MAG: DUF4870 domain-containing protein [Chitinophagaceae bacterium]|nr:MAG: DUF4870 domain-containing protein [Chitinophagaceae bacterium]